MKKFLFMSSLLLGVCSLAHADDKADKCLELKTETIRYSQTEPTRDEGQQAAKAAIVSALLASYQAAQCLPLTIDEALKISKTVGK